MTHWVIRHNGDKTEASLTEAGQYNDDVTKDSEGEYMKVVHVFEAPSWELAKEIYEAFLFPEE